MHMQLNTLCDEHSCTDSTSCRLGTSVWDRLLQHIHIYVQSAGYYLATCILDELQNYRIWADVFFNI